MKLFRKAMLTLMLDEHQGEFFITFFTVLLVDMPIVTLFAIMEAEHLN